MFNITNLMNKITDRGHDREGPSKSPQDDTSSDQSAEGFLCPKCLKAFPTPETLQSHYETDHEADEHSIASQESGGSYGIQATNQQTSDLSLYIEGGSIQEMKGTIQVQGPSLEDITDLQIRLNQALLNIDHLEQEKKHLEQKAAQLAQDYVTVKAHSDEGDSVQLSMKERLKVLEAQVAHRESIDDTAVLRQELVQVQRVMDELNQERERERDELKTELDLYKEKYGDIHKETSGKDTIESLSLLLTTTKDELLKLQKEHTDLLDNIQANEGSSTALQQLNQMNELSIQIENLQLQNTEKDLEIDSLKKILQENIEKLAETANTIHGLEKNIFELEQLKSHWKEKAYIAQNSLLSNEKEMIEFKTNLETKMTELSIESNSKLTKFSEMFSNLKLSLESACTDAENYKLKLSENDKIHEELSQNYQSLLRENSNQKQENLDLMVKLNSSKTEILHLGVQKASLETVIFELQKTSAETLANFEKDKLKLQEDLFNTQDYLSSLTMENQGHKTKIESLEKCIEELKNTSEEAAEVLKTSLEQTRNENSHLTKQNKDLIIDLKKTAEAAEILKKKISSMQDDLDEVTGEKLALEAKIEASQLEQKTLLERCFSSTSTCDSLQRTVNEIRRRLEESQAALHEMGRENQNLQLKLEKLVGRKWTEDSDAARCIKCEKVFTLLIRRHHCRNCFKIYCNECSAKTAVVESDRKPVRVCDSCFNELSSK